MTLYVCETSRNAAFRLIIPTVSVLSSSWLSLFALRQEMCGRLHRDKQVGQTSVGAAIHLWRGTKKEEEQEEEEVEIVEQIWMMLGKKEHQGRHQNQKQTLFTIPLAFLHSNATLSKMPVKPLM